MKGARLLLIANCRSRLPEEVLLAAPCKPCLSASCGCSASEENIRMRISLVLLILGILSLASLPLSAQGTGEGTQFAVFAGGKPTRFDTMIESLKDTDVVFIGENHDHKLGHALEVYVLNALYQHGVERALALEMFERDVQGVLDEYLLGLISEQSFLQASRPWPNYATDYKPMIEFCREKGLPVVASNAPRRYVSMVSRKGQGVLTSLPPASRRWIASFPYAMDLPAEYDRQLTEIFTQPHEAPKAPANGDKAKEGDKPTTAPTKPATMSGMPSVANLKESQSLWDATMADSILQFRRAHPERKILHVNGAMHSDSGFGIVYRLRKADPTLKIRLITVRPDASFPNLPGDKYDRLADYVIVTRPDEKK